MMPQLKAGLPPPVANPMPAPVQPQPTAVNPALAPAPASPGLPDYFKRLNVPGF